MHILQHQRLTGGTAGRLRQTFVSRIMLWLRNGEEYRVLIGGYASDMKFKFLFTDKFLLNRFKR